MKKTAAGFALAAVLGLSVASATPAMAVVGAYENCSAAAADGVYNIPVGAPGYGPHLDNDGDGIGCENGDVAYRPAPVVEAPAPVETPAPVAVVPAPVAVVPAPVQNEAPQIVQVPVGAPATGVVENDGTQLSLLLAAGALTAVAATSVAFRRMSRNA